MLTYRSVNLKIFFIETPLPKKGTKYFPRKCIKKWKWTFISNYDYYISLDKRFT